MSHTLESIALENEKLKAEIKDYKETLKFIVDYSSFATETSNRASQVLKKWTTIKD